MQKWNQGLDIIIFCLLQLAIPMPIPISAGFSYRYQCQYQYLLAIALQYQCQFQYLFSALCNINIGWHWQHFAISIFASYIVNLHPPTPQYQKPHPLRICDLVHLCRKSIPPYIFLPSSKCWWVDGTIRSQD